MKKQELLNIIDEELLDKLFGFCYTRTSDSHAAWELCSDVVYALVKAANTEGELADVYAFIWRIARNVYADWSEHRRRVREWTDAGDPALTLSSLICEEEENDDERRAREETVRNIYRRIAYLTRAYRDVMVAFYLDGQSIAQIAAAQKIGEGTVRQRLFSARRKLKEEVEIMKENTKITRPVVLDKIDYIIWGSGSPGWSDPRNVCYKQFSKHIIWLCRKTPKTPAEIAAELNVPTVYVEEELEVLLAGENGKYGLLKKTESGKYIINFILLEPDFFTKATELYREYLPQVADIVIDYVMTHKDEYMAFPYINRRVDFNLVLWQHIHQLSGVFKSLVERELKKEIFADVKKTERPFHVFGYVDHGVYFGGGCDGVNANNVCGYRKVYLENIYVSRIRKHFDCGLNVATESQIQMAIRAIEGLEVAALSKEEQETAAKAIACGYLFREGDMLYTKLLVNRIEDGERLFDINERFFEGGYLNESAKALAKRLGKMLRDGIAEHLLGEWMYANSLISAPLIDEMIEILISRGLLIPPEDGIGAEGCWMMVEK
ncbi:MAG: RNA polymerase sigma factor [Clostridia bacterium]|nr:RNA polymerase sigma factor [Clostridia bacterium]